MTVVQVKVHKEVLNRIIQTVNVQISRSGDNDANVGLSKLLWTFHSGLSSCCRCWFRQSDLKTHSGFKLPPLCLENQRNLSAEKTGVQLTNMSPEMREEVPVRAT